MAEVKKTFAVTTSTHTHPSPPPLFLLSTSRHLLAPLLKHKFLEILPTSLPRLPSAACSPHLSVLSTPRSISVPLINNQSAGAEARGPAPSVSIGKPEREREREGRTCKRGGEKAREEGGDRVQSISIRGQVHSAGIDHNLERCNCWSETGGGR